MIKWIPHIVIAVTLMWTGAFIFTTSCSPPPPEPVAPVIKNIRAIPKGMEILYDRDTGVCWVVERDKDGLIKESLFSGNDVEECYQFSIKGE